MRHLRGAMATRFLLIAWSSDGRLASGSRPDRQGLGSSSQPVHQATLEGHSRLGSLCRVVERRPARVVFLRPDNQDLGSTQPASARPRSRPQQLFTLLRGRAMAGSRLVPETEPSRSRGSPPRPMPRQALEGACNFGRSIAWSSDGLLASGSAMTGPSRSGIPQPAGAEATLEGHSNFVHSSCVGESTAGLASGSEDRTVKIWDLATGRCQATSRAIAALFALSRGRATAGCAPGSGDRTIKIARISPPGRCQATLEGHGNSVFLVRVVERRPARVWFRRSDHQDLGSRNQPIPGHARGP